MTRNEIVKRYRDKHRKKYRSYVNSYNSMHRTKIRSWSRDYNKRVRKKILSFFGDKCKKCGFSDPRALQLDHVNGGGSAYSKIFGNGNTSRYRDIKLHPEKYQLLCANCNWIKREENREVTPLKSEV